MTSPYAPPRELEAPQTVPHKFGLFSVATVIESPAGEPHWELGGVWESYKCGPASSWPMTCTIDGNPTKDATKGVPYVEALPFAVYGWFACSPVGHWEDAKIRAFKHLVSGEERAVESALYLGEDNQGNDLGLALTLVSADTVDVTPTPGTAVPVSDGVGLLETWLGVNAHSPGVIWGSPDAVTAMVDEGVLRHPGPADTVLRTYLWTAVIAAAGMSGLIGPDGSEADPGTFWLYATSVPVIRRSAPIEFDAGAQLNRSNNDLVARAERIYTAGWDCGTAAVLVTAVTAGGGGGGGDASAANQVTEIARLTSILAATDGLEALATAGNALLTDIETATDGLETLIGTTNTTLTTIDGRVDGLETLVGATNTALGTANATLTAIDGRVDGLEGLTGTTNTELAAANVTLTAIDGRVDGLEALVGTTNTTLTTIDGRVDGLETLVGTTNTTLTTIDGRVDGLETLVTATNTKLDSLLAQASDLAVTAVGTSGAAVTLTVPAVASLKHMISSVEITAYNAADRTGGATPVTVTTTNLPGTPAFTFASAGAIGTTDTYAAVYTPPRKSTTANTDTTIVCPATTSVIWRVNVTYFTAA